MEISCGMSTKSCGVYHVGYILWITRCISCGLYPVDHSMYILWVISCGLLDVYPVGYILWITWHILWITLHILWMYPVNYVLYRVDYLTDVKKNTKKNESRSLDLWMLRSLSVSLFHCLSDSSFWLIDSCTNNHYEVMKPCIMCDLPSWCRL